MALGESHSWLGNSFERNAEGKTSLVPGNFVPGAASSGGKSN